MLFSWLRNRRRKKLLAGPFPVRWQHVLEKNVGHYPLLAAHEQARLRDVVRILIAEKQWEGTAGMFVTEEMKVAAARAIADVINEEELSEEYVIPSVFDRRVAEAVAAAVGEEAKRAGIARTENDLGMDFSAVLETPGVDRRRLLR